MQKNKLILFILITLFLIPAGCGYYFPTIYSGPPKTVYMPQWKNKTSKLGLDSKLYRKLNSFFQRQAGAITITKNKNQADLILAGEILSIELPGTSWDETTTTDVKVKISVRYVLQDLKNGQIIWEVPKQEWSSDYPANTLNLTAETNAIDEIIDDISEYIYTGVIDKLNQSKQ